MGWQVTLFKDKNFRGGNVTLGPGSFVVLSDVENTNWNNKTSSIRVQGPTANLAPNECNQHPMLFQYDNFRGRSVRLINDVSDLSQSNFNDKASSLCVPAGWTIDIFKRKNYKGNRHVELPGPQVLPDLHNNNLGGDIWGDKISSVKVN